MCGICGILTEKNGQPVKKTEIKAMVSTMSHRGPDAEGIFLDSGIGLGHARLKIIDLSDDANQPMSNEDGSVQLVFNGEIYNFKELRKNLKKRGHHFRTSSDSEVIVHLYEEKGKDLVDDLIGMFAFAVWDGRQKKLLLARDRAGKKPLFYLHADGIFAFASELHALTKLSIFRKDINLSAIHHYLTYQYIPAPMTIFRGACKLLPAHLLEYSGGEKKISRYWKLNYRDKLTGSQEELKERFLSLFEDAVKIRMVSDVPLGAFLSGGLDSSAVVAVMAGMASRPVKTFSIGYAEKDFDETRYAEKVAKLFGTEHYFFRLVPDVIDVMPSLLKNFGEPFADPSAIPTYYVSKYTKEHVTVALNGDGGDESFAGYDRYRADRICMLADKVPRSLMIVAEKLISALPYSQKQTSFFVRLKRLAKAFTDAPEQRYLTWIKYFDAEMKKKLYSQEFCNVCNEDAAEYIYSLFGKADADDWIDKMLFVDVNSYLPGALLPKVDIASMANSLEARSPFLDHRLMEFAASLPAELKMKGFTTKYFLKKAFAGVLPGDILHRRKMGFGVPLNHWFRGELKDYLWQTLKSNECKERGYFQPKFISTLLTEHDMGLYDHSYRLWALLVLEVWHRGISNG